jgi:tetratricopeptide (TPR) repeat protein
MKASRWAAKALTFSTAALLSAQAFALGWPFVPTAAEFAQWPMHCRVQYNWVNRGENEFARVYGQRDVDTWRQKIGEVTFSGLHHYCGAVVFLQRAPLADDPAQKQYWIGRAIDDGQYSYIRSEIDSIVYPDIAVTMALARKANGEVDEAIRILKHAISVHPTRVEPYGALALIHWEKKELRAARDLLMEADAATGGQAAEVKYNLGLLNIELGNLDAAVANARDAYALKYPLPGLKRKLTSLGRWPPPQASQ